MRPVVGVTAWRTSSTTVGGASLRALAMVRECTRSSEGSVFLGECVPPSQTVGRSERGLCPRNPQGEAGRARAVRLAPPVGRGTKSPSELRSWVKRVAAALVRSLLLRSVPVDERPHVERVRHAANLVLDLEQQLVGVGIDDLDEAPLVGMALHRDEPAVHELLVRPVEVRDVDGDVMAVVRWNRIARLPEDEAQLLPADTHLRGGGAATF